MCLLSAYYVLISFSHGYSATLAAKLIIKLELSWVLSWNGSITTLQLEFYTQTNFVVDFIGLNLNFIYKNDKFAFEPWS